MHCFRFTLIVFVSFLFYNSNLMCQCQKDDIVTMDIATPINASLSAFYKRSFAYQTVKERLPRILTQTLDSLVRNKEDIGKSYGADAKEELKTVIGDISKLKYEIQTNKPMRNLTSNAPDVKFYNDYLAQANNPSYFSAVWLHTECYMYRRIREIFELTEHLKPYDPFRLQKQESYLVAVESIKNLSGSLLPILNDSDEEDIKENFIKLLKLNLWGNKCDLSFSGGEVEQTENPFELLNKLEPNILSDESTEIWNAISNTSISSNTVDIILDNAGYELFTDLCLADFIITKGLAQNIRMYVKTIPWFVSDVMTHDFHWILNQLKTDENENLRTLGLRWETYMHEKVWTIVENDFFTLPVDFSHMQEVNPELYQQLSQPKLLIFKGDLNYRKLFGEKNWDPTVPTIEALNGFGPSNLCTLRTIKSDIVCGLKSEVVKEVREKDPTWMETGDYGVMQFVEKK